MSAVNIKKEECDFMAKAKKPMEEGSIHRAHIWEICFYTMNNTATNTYLVLMMSVSYYLVGIVGLLTVVAGTVVTVMRIWDGVTDPFIGLVIDKTNGRFGKNRPFIVIGEVILFCASFLIFRLIPAIPGNSTLRMAVYIVLYMCYIVGYTCQCVVTKSAQSCLTNDPEQRPIFSMFDSVFNIVLMSVWYPVYLAGTLMPVYTLSSVNAADKIQSMIVRNPNLATVLDYAADGSYSLSAMYNPEMWQHFQLVCGAVAACLSVCAIIGLWRKDRVKYFGVGKAVKVGFRDYADVLMHNHAIQALVASAASDKLCSSMMSNATVMICLFGIVFGNYSLYSSTSAICAVPTALLSVLLINYVARYMGQKKALLLGTWGGVIGGIVMLFLVLGVPIFGFRMSMPAFSLTSLSTYAGLFKPSNWSAYALLFIIVYIVWRGLVTVSGNIVIPMTADCADYEVYRSGKYVPGLMGTLFSFVDKMISSLAATFVAIMFAIIGFSETLPTLETAYSASILWVTLACFIGAPMVGWIINLVAMHFYPLSKEKMEEIEGEIARIKAESGQLE